MIDFYAVATANGQKAAIMLEEVGVDYRTHLIDLIKGEHKSPDYLAINPVGKVPAIIDRDTGGDPVTVFETGAILLYLAEKTGKLMPTAAAERAAMHVWMHVVAAGASPAFTGQFIFGTLAQEKVPSAIAYFLAEAARFLEAIDGRLAEAEYLAGGSYSIADILAYPVAVTSAGRLEDGLDPYPNIRRWRDQLAPRPAIQRGMAVGT